ncbi:hypothetical protein P22_0025 [Propionispora sp. 2/2-37]|uniref:siroheme decarboxylase subunit alpha n=1 Tax=Propionispora sp. 2/2-37 TaxID=1677858 RepID=UPI0006BB6A0D|nr:AsnC family transcriptional regulator [Propionispora sp. 2/2-37]CUH93963.1 hypothetical protein P22_0025 [Propionispora sp. 2/2-37]
MLSAFDKALLNRIQEELPLVDRPFAVLAEDLGVEENDVIERLQYLKQHGFIRRMGPFFDSNQLGYIGTLVAVSVTPDKVATVAAAINRHPGVTHNYERYSDDDNIYNLWFTLLSPDVAAQEKVLNTVKGMAGVEKLISLPAEKKFKVSVRFTL